MVDNMIKFKDYIAEDKQYENGGLTIFDIDDTLFHTTAKINVIKNRRKVKSLTNQQFNTYILGKDEHFDFSEFKDAEKFNRESTPIHRMIGKAKTIIKNAEKHPNSRVIMVTARNDFDDKDLFLDTFRKQGIDIDTVRVERAGKITDIANVAQKKVVVIRNYINTKKFKRVRLFDDSIANLKAFLTLKNEYPHVKFEAFFAHSDGTVKEVK